MRHQHVNRDTLTLRMKFDLDVTSDASAEGSSRPSEHATSDCKPLLEAAHLTIYRDNPFRVTGLPVDATAKQIARHVDKLKQMEELGQASNPAAFALDPSPTRDQLRDAIQRLKDPERRLIDEFFWFWPKIFGDSANDPALQALAAGDMSKAYEIWELEERDYATASVANHNIAVMFHLVALDWTIYQINAEVDPARAEKIRGYWSNSLKRWEKVPSDDPLWEAVKSRIRSVDDRRLTTGFGRRFAETLPTALDRINAEAALKFAEKGHFDWARAHVAYMRATHQGLDDVEKTADLVLTPARNRVRQYIRSAEQESAATPSTASESTRRMLEGCLPLKGMYELFYGENAHQTVELFDEVALKALDCLQTFHKAAGADDVFLDLIKRTLPFASSTEVRNRIQRSRIITPVMRIRDSSGEGAKSRLDKIKRILIPELATIVEAEGIESELVPDLSDWLAVSLRGLSVDAHNDEKDFRTSVEAIRLAAKLAKEPDLKKRIADDLKTVTASLGSSICHFCGTQASKSGLEYVVLMYGDIQRSYGTLHYKHQSVNIGRCEDCKRLHTKYALKGWLYAFGSLAEGLLVGYVAGGDQGAFIGGGITFLIGTVMIYRFHRPTSTGAGRKSISDHPVVKELLARRWRFGRSPGKYES